LINKYILLGELQASFMTFTIYCGLQTFLGHNIENVIINMNTKYIIITVTKTYKFVKFV